MLAAQSLIRTSKGAGGGSYVTLPSVNGVSEYVQSSISLLADADDVTLEELLEARELLEVPGRAAGGASGGPRRSSSGSGTRSRTSRCASAPSGSSSTTRTSTSRVIDGCRNTLLAIAAQPVFAVLQRNLARSRLGGALPPHDQRASPSDRGRDRGRRRGRGRRRDARPSRVPAPVLRAGLAKRAVTRAFGIQGSGQLVDGCPIPASSARWRCVRRSSATTRSGPATTSPTGTRSSTSSSRCRRSQRSRARITIGAGIVLLPLRHPSVVAKEFASLDYVSGGRTILGVGVGGESGPDFDAVGVVAARARRAHRRGHAGAARAVRRSGRRASRGGSSRSTGISIEPPPAQPGGPPLWVGGRSEAAIRRAATLGDGWIPIWVSAERFGEGARAAARARRRRRSRCRRTSATRDALRAPARALLGRLLRARRRPLLRRRHARASASRAFASTSTRARSTSSSTSSSSRTPSG